MKSLGNMPSYWWLMALAGSAIVIGLGIGLWRTKTVKLLRAIKLENRGVPLLWDGYLEEAKALLTKSLRLAEEAVGPDDAEVGPIIANLAQVYWFQGKFPEAEHLFHRAIAVRENAVGPEDPFLESVLNNLAKMYRDQGRDDEAAPLKERANSILEATPDEKKPKTIRRGVITRAGFAPEPPEWQELMNAADAAEDEDKAEKHLRTAIEVAEYHNPSSPYRSPYLGRSLHALGWLCYHRNDFAQAETHLLRAISIRESAFGPDHVELADSLSNLAAIYRAQGKDAEAESLLLRALTITETPLGPRRLVHPNLATILRNLAAFYCDQGRYADAEPLAERAASISERNPASDAHAVAHGLHLLALTRLSQGRYGDAVPNFARAVILFETGYGFDDPQLINPLLDYASALWKDGRDGETKAEELIQRSLSIAEKHFGSGHPKVAKCLDNLAELYSHQGKVEDAKLIRGRAQAIGLIH